MRAGIVIDKWKLAIFEIKLSAAGYTWEQHEGPVRDTYSLIIVTDDQAALMKVVRAANQECAKQ